MFHLTIAFEASQHHIAFPDEVAVFSDLTCSMNQNHHSHSHTVQPAICETFIGECQLFSSATRSSTLKHDYFYYKINSK